MKSYYLEIYLRTVHFAPTPAKGWGVFKEARKISDTPKKKSDLAPLTLAQPPSHSVSEYVGMKEDCSISLRQVPPHVLSPKGRKTKQYKVNLEEWAATGELGKRNEKENELATSSPSTLKLCEEKLSPWLKCNLQMNCGWYSGLIHSDSSACYKV